MKRARLAAAALALVALAAASARCEDEAPIAEAELKGLAEKALAAAVTSSGKSTFALDDAAVVCEGGGAKPEAVAAALRSVSGKARLVKHAENLDAPMLHVRFSTLVVSTAKESSIDHGLYLELEASNRGLIHANVTSLHKAGQGGKTQGHHSAQTLDSLADGFASKYFEKPLPNTLTVVGKAGTNSIAQQSLVERVIQRLIAGKAQVIAARVGSVDVERPKNVRLLGAQVGLLVSLSNESDVLFIDGSDLAAHVTAYRYHYPPSGMAGGPGAAVNHMKKLAASVEFQFRNDGYRVKPGGAKGKVWILEAKLDAGGGDTLKNELTAAARAPLIGHETPRWLFEAKDGPATVADAKAAGIDIVVQPIFKPAKNGRKQVMLEVRSVADDQVVDAPAHTYTDEQPK